MKKMLQLNENCIINTIITLTYIIFASFISKSAARAINRAIYRENAEKLEGGREKGFIG